MTSASSTKNPESTRLQGAPKNAEQVEKAVALGKEMMKKGDEVTKVEVARAMYDLVHEESREVIVQAFIAGANALTQQECPPDMRSRLLALQSVAFLGSTPIGSPITGMIADNISAEWALAYGSVISLMGVGVASVYWNAGTRQAAELSTTS